MDFWDVLEDGSLVVHLNAKNEVLVWELLMSGANISVPARHTFDIPSKIEEQFTCVRLAKLLSQKPVVNRKRERDSDAATQPGVLFLGTGEGQILIMDLIEGAIVNTLGKSSGHIGAVRGIVNFTSNNTDTLVSIGNDKSMIRWNDILSGTPKRKSKQIFQDSPIDVVSKVSYHPNSGFNRQLVVLGGLGNMAVVDVETLEIIISCTGGASHPTSISSYYRKLENGDEYIYSVVCYEHYRGIHFISMKLGASFNPATDYHCNAIQCDDFVKKGSFNFQQGQPLSFSASVGNSIVYWCEDLKKSGVSEGKFEFNILYKASVSMKQGDIFFNSLLSPTQMFIIFGVSDFPTFKSIICNVREAMQRSAPIDVFLIPISTSSVQDRKKLKQAVVYDPNLLPAPIRSSNSQLKQPLGLSDVLVSIQEKVSRQDNNEYYPEKKKILPSGSVVATIVQGLHSNDELLLGQGLQSGRDPAILKKTVVDLPVESIYPFLENLTERIIHRASHVGENTKWVIAIIQAHSSYLMTLPEAVECLTRLHSILLSKTTNLQALISLQGRITQSSFESNKQSLLRKRLKEKRRPSIITEESLIKPENTKKRGESKSKSLENKDMSDEHENKRNEQNNDDDEEEVQFYGEEFQDDLDEDDDEVQMNGNEEDEEDEEGEEEDEEDEERDEILISEEEDDANDSDDQEKSNSEFDEDDEDESDDEDI